MDQAELAARMIDAGPGERAEILRGQPAADLALAYRLKDICLDAWSSAPARATAAAEALRALLAHLDHHPEVAALTAWADGVAALVDGRMEEAVRLLDEAHDRFISLGQERTAAATRVIKLYALAMLGRYEEAITHGTRARDVFLLHGDLLAAGKIEHNIGNIYKRRDRYDEAEEFQRAARARFAALGDQKQLAKIDNCLANIHSLQHKFRSAEELYRQAFRRAEATGLSVTQAEIEASMGNLALFQGRYDRALDYLERSRRRYAALGLPHQSAIAEQEIADAYLELNLVPEANAVYERTIPTFAELGMRAEQALALANRGRALIHLGQPAKAHELLREARQLYAAEGNQVGEATVTLTEAQLHYSEGNYFAAGVCARMAEIPFAVAGTWRKRLLARWLRGEAARLEGQTAEAREVLEETLRDAEEQALPQVAQRCLTSLGLLAAAAGDSPQAEALLQRAAEIIENLRAPLPAEEFRTAFFADKLTPYGELMRLCLTQRARTAEAFAFAERARARALVDMLGGMVRPRTAPRDPFEAELHERLEELRDELNWFYSQINRPPPKDSPPRGADEMTALHEAVREREGRTLELMRQLQHRGGPELTRPEPLEVGRLQAQLGEESALVEYASLDGELLAFVVTRDRVEVVRGLGTEDAAAEALGQLRFQLEALRYGAGRVRQHLARLTARAQHHLHTLYRQLLAPVEPLIGARRLVIVPHRALHYLPFHALYDGEAYVIERREVAYAPSAAVLSRCLARPAPSWQSALFLGAADEFTPRVRDEIAAVAPLAPAPRVFLDEEATLAALRQNAAEADIIHLACHGQFRPESPLFSSLKLSDGWLTVRDTYHLQLRPGLVTLSACETGISSVAPGDELIGLSRGLFSAGASSLLLSLWTVDDEATARLMSYFYDHLLRAAENPAAALRSAQLRLLKEQPHPFFWSPFVLLGRW